MEEEPLTRNDAKSHEIINQELLLSRFQRHSKVKSQLFANSK